LIVHITESKIKELRIEDESMLQAYTPSLHEYTEADGKYLFFLGAERGLMARGRKAEREGRHFWFSQTVQKVLRRKREDWGECNLKKR